MTKRKHSRMMLRIIAGAMAVALVSGTAVMTPIADFVGTGIVASAATYIDSVDASQLKEGDILKAGLALKCEDDVFTVFDENNDTIVFEDDYWDVDKDYTINSITFDSDEYVYTIHVTSGTSTSTGTVYTGDAEAANLKSGDKLKAGAHLVCEDDYFQILDENNNEITAVIDDWNVDKDYTIASITYDSDEYVYTIHVKSAKVVSTAKELVAALAAGGEIQLANDISIDQNVTISKECTIDFNGKKITFGGTRDSEYHLEVNATTTLKNGTLTSSCTDDPRFYILEVSSDTVAENMTISQPGNGGGHGIVYVGGSNARFTMKDSTITYVQNGKYSARGIQAEINATLLFYGENFINTSNSSSGWYDWNIIKDCNCYFYSGTLEINYHFAVYNSSTKVYFCGGAVKNTRSGDGVFSGLSADKIILQNGDDDYALYSDEAYTTQITTAQATGASAIYSKIAARNVTWLNYDGTELEKDENVEKGTTPKYDGTTPTKDSTAQYTYTFSGWTSDGGTTVYTAETLPAVTGDVTYTAVFDAELITHSFTADSSLTDTTLTVTDHEENAVTVTDGAFNAPVGSKISASVPLAFDGATATETVDGSTFIYTVTAVTGEQVTISNAQVDITKLTVTIESQTYTGSAFTPEVFIMNNGTSLVENTDYTVTYENNTDVGTATAKITGKGKYKGETTVDFTINPKNIAELAVSFDLDGDGTAYSPTTYTADSNKPSIIYDGKEYTPTAKLMFGDNEVPADSYDVSITPAQDADTYTITFTAKENTNFTGTRTFDWDITKADMNITMTDGLEFNRVGGSVALECVDESKFAVTGTPDGSTTTLIYFSEQGLQLPKPPTEAGNYTVKAVVTNDNYNDGEAS